MGKGFSPLDAAIDGISADLRSQSGKMAVIAFSDGEDMEKFAPVAAAQRMKSAYGDRICIYTVHLGENQEGRKLLQQVADASQCGSMVTGDSISTPQGMADFVEKVFLKAAEPPKQVVKPVVREEPKPVVMAEVKVPAAEAPKVVIAEPVTIELNVQFATGKSNIQAKYHNEIKKVADYMTKYPETKAVIEGHTDNVGKEAANVKLSQNRANSVKDYIVSKFKIDSSRMEATGYGPKKPIASNSTKEGRQKNRRVTAVFSSTTK
jgi:OOP family OmpA-OmpF porin